MAGRRNPLLSTLYKRPEIKDFRRGARGSYGRGVGGSVIVDELHEASKGSKFERVGCNFVFDTANVMDGVDHPLVYVVRTRRGEREFCQAGGLGGGGMSDGSPGMGVVWTGDESS